MKSAPVPTVIPDLVQGMTSGPAMMNIRWSRAAYMEVQRLRRDRYVDFVVAPAWDQEGLYCVLDSGLKTIVSMNTTFRRFSEIEEAKHSREYADGSDLDRERISRFRPPVPRQ